MCRLCRLAPGGGRAGPRCASWRWWEWGIGRDSMEEDGVNEEDDEDEVDEQRQQIAGSKQQAAGRLNS